MADTPQLTGSMASTPLAALSIAIVTAVHPSTDFLSMVLVKYQSGYPGSLQRLRKEISRADHTGEHSNTVAANMQQIY